MNAKITSVSMHEISGSSLFNQHLADRRAWAYQTVEQHLSDQTRAELEGCKARLLKALPHQGVLYNNTVLVMYGGGKDSSYLLGATRFVQLEIAAQYGTTFKLRVVTNRHAGMPKAVLENIDRVYSALECAGDPDVELLLIDGQVVSEFNVNSPLPRQLRARNREDILITGHRTRGMFRPMFCNACNLSMVNAMTLGLSYGEGADLMVTGDSPREQRDYFRWTLKTARKFGVRTKGEGETGLRQTLRMIDGIGERYFESIYGDAEDDGEREHEIRVDGIKREPVFFSIFEDTRYEAGAHWNLLTEGLHFVFDDLAFSFSESDCGNPALMAHLHGLKMERIHRRYYDEGVQEYARFAISLMEKKNFPPHLIELMRERYRDPSAIRHMRAKMDAYAKEAFDLSEAQLVCLIYSPFTEKGKFLESYLTNERPHLLKHSDELHALLSAESDSESSGFLAREIIALSGLTIEQSRLLYRSQLVLAESETAADDPILVVLQKDPHKELIRSERGEGEFVTELITGR